MAPDHFNMVDYLDYLGVIVIFIYDLCRVCNRLNRAFWTISHYIQLFRDWTYASIRVVQGPACSFVHITGNWVYDYPVP